MLKQHAQRHSCTVWPTLVTKTMTFVIFRVPYADNEKAMTLATCALTTLCRDSGMADVLDHRHGGGSFPACDLFDLCVTHMILYVIHIGA